MAKINAWSLELIHEWSTAQKAAYNREYYRKNKVLSLIRHSGVIGMKWGERRYQNEDGTLTPLGKLHYGSGRSMRGFSSGDHPIWRHKVGEGYGLASRLNAYGYGGNTVVEATKAALPKMQAERRKFGGQIARFKTKPYDRRYGRTEQEWRDMELDRAADAMTGLRDSQRALAAARLELKTKDLPYERDLERYSRKSSLGYDGGLASSSSAVQSALLGFQHLKDNNGNARNNPYVTYGDRKSTSRSYLGLVNAGKLFVEGVSEPVSIYDKNTGISTRGQRGSGYDEWVARTYPVNQDYMGRTVLTGTGYHKRMPDGSWLYVSSGKKPNQTFTRWNGKQE